MTLLAKTVTQKGLAGFYQSAFKYGASVLCQRGYHQNVVDHYENPRNVGSMDKNDPNVGTGLVGAPACGDVMKLQIRVGQIDR